MTANLKDQKGYIIEVQGFSPSGVQSSQAMANSVVRYLVEKNEIPVYRIFVMGMGNAKMPAPDGGAKPAHGNRVEISLLKNDVDQLASASQPNGRHVRWDEQPKRTERLRPRLAVRSGATEQHITQLSANSSQPQH